ncbi:MAG: hypothetical protein KKC68_02935 [Candidatus Thermoplasmatota archaeon]|nr:hypothetical protein [Candidatus Thermoplasmatota archaeon]
MNKITPYENYPIRIPLLAILISIISYSIGAVILSEFGITVVIIYLAYCVGIELLVIFRSCKDCYYYGKICGLGKGKIAPIFVKQGNSNKFKEKKISWYDLIPDFLVAIIPVIGGIILLLYNFSFLLLGLIILLSILFFGGTAYIRGSFACKYCKQKEIGCPADKIFNKNQEK